MFMAITAGQSYIFSPAVSLCYLHVVSTNFMHSNSMNPQAKTTFFMHTNLLDRDWEISVFLVRILSLQSQSA